MSVASTVERQMLDLINFERTSRGLDSLALELRLNDASEDHSEWMDDTRIFSHTGVGGSSPGDRIVDAGFTLSGNRTWGENIAYQSERGAPGIADDVVDLHTSLMNSPGHRANILNPNFELIGIGIEVGDGRGFDAVYVTQNFARTSAPVQIDSGTQPPADPDSDVVSGTTGNDRLDGGATNETMQGFNGADTIYGRSGDDTIEGGGGSDRIYGGSGDDLASGGAANDLVYGGAGEDALFGDQGQDILRGNDGNDTMNGGDGNDRLYGGADNDLITGGAGNDTLNGGAGRDRLDGGDGNDTMTGREGSDVFVFSAGRDVVRDFSDGDVIDLSGLTEITSFADLTGGAHMRQVGSSTVIDDQDDNIMILRGTDMDDLQASDFLF